MPKIEIDSETLHILQDKAAKFDDLKSKISSHYTSKISSHCTHDSNSDLSDIGEIAASALINFIGKDLYMNLKLALLKKVLKSN